MVTDLTAPKKFIDANSPIDKEGRVHHLGLKKGEVSNLVITVGDFQRANLISCLFENQNDLIKILSNRGFLTITGLYKNKLVSVIAIGMGMPMMDFLVRELVCVVDRPLFILRFGSCGSIRSDIPLGSLVTANGCFCCTKDYLNFNRISKKNPYNFSDIIYGENEFRQLLKSTANSHNIRLYEGLNMTTDSFYSSQGRISDDFDDKNSALLEEIRHKYKDCSTIEMESYMLYHLSQINLNKEKRIRSFAVHMVFADRINNQFIDIEMREIIEPKYSKLILEALVKLNM